MTELFLSAFVTFFAVNDPPGTAMICAGLMSDATPAERRAMAIRATLIGTAVLFGFALFGKAVLGLLGIGLDAFRIAGGAMLFLIALEMLFDKRTEHRGERAERVVRAGEAVPGRHDDLSVFPLAFPLLVGPGSITTSMLLMSRAEGAPERITVLVALSAVMLLAFISLLATGPMMRFMGAKAEALVSRLLALLLAALAAQFVIDGLKGSFA
jgi:multiple antibiotic resistance protein